MTPNAKLDALIARIEGGEALARDMDAEIGEIAFANIGARSVFSNDELYLEMWPDCYGSIPCPSYHKSLDAIMSLARNAREVQQLLTVAAVYSEPPNLEPILRAMLAEALKMRRT